MAFPFLFVLAAIFIILVKNVNSKLNNPDDSLGSDTVSSNPTEKDPDFPPVDEVFNEHKEPETEPQPEPVFTQAA